MTEKTKALLKNSVIYILVFAFGITIGIMCLKGTESYKNNFSLSERLTFDAYHLLTSLDSNFDNELPYDRIYEDLANLNFVSSLAIASDGAFFVGYDEDMSYDEFNALFECSVKAKFIAKDLSAGKEISSEDSEWFEKFKISVNKAYAHPDIPSYRVLAQSFIEQKIYKPKS
ncbi:MAG: hypothetical protein IKL57_04245 [Oscillospiraceae bacterium]|nr:hypothetical protein [Oscillospiraceae bacterium]